MSTTKKLNNITKAQIAGNGVQALANRPNVSAQYGVSGLSPTQLKLWFDRLATLLAEKINAIQDAISSEEAAKYIRVLLDDYAVENLDDLVKSFSNGGFGNILQVFASKAETKSEPLQEVLYNIAQALSENQEDIDNLWEKCGATFRVNIDDRYFHIYLFNKEGDVLSVHSIDKMVNTDRIVDSAVVTAKIKDLCVTAAKLANGSVTTDKLASNSVTREKIADLSVVAHKLANNSVTTDKIVGLGVTTEKLADRAVTTEKIGMGAVTGYNLALGSVDSGKLADKLQTLLLELETFSFDGVAYDPSTGKLTFSTRAGIQREVDLPLELITSGGYYDATKGSEAVVLSLANGGEIRIPVTDMLSDLISYMDGIREKIYDLQEAPPISALSDTILLCTPTLAQLAALS